MGNKLGVDAESMDAIHVTLLIASKTATVSNFIPNSAITEPEKHDQCQPFTSIKKYTYQLFHRLFKFIRRASKFRGAFQQNKNAKQTENISKSNASQNDTDNQNSNNLISPLTWLNYCDDLLGNSMAFQFEDFCKKVYENFYSKSNSELILQTPKFQIRSWSVTLKCLEILLQKAHAMQLDLDIHITGSKGFEVGKNILSLFPNRFSLYYHREVSCALIAINLIVKSNWNYIFRYDRTHRALNEVKPDPQNYLERPINILERDAFYPFLLVNFKAGVSFHKVLSPNVCIRIGGSTIGGATFSGLCRLLIDEPSTPESLQKLAQEGDNAKCDMLVHDIYGGSAPTIGLAGDVIASTFGKMQPNEKAYLESSDIEMPTSADISQSILTMISFNVMQQAYWQAKLHSITRICILGFLLDTPAFLASIQHSIYFWSKGSVQINFFKNAQFLESLGACLQNSNSNF